MATLLSEEEEKAIYKKNVCPTNENEEDEDDNEVDDEEEDDDDKLLSYLFDKAFLKQHAFAILIAFLATGFSYFHIILSSPTTTTTATIKNDFAYTTTNDHSPTRTRPLKSTAVHHHHSYRRTNNLVFCPIDFLSPTESNQQRIQRVLSVTTTNSIDHDKFIDPNLELFTFNFPKEYAHLMKYYYNADDTMDDNYNQVIVEHNNDDDDDEKRTSMDPNYTCMIETMTINSKRSTIPMHTVAYIHPDIETYYTEDSHVDSMYGKRNTINNGLSLLHSNQNKEKNKEMKAADLSYKGLTAKFVNLSPNQVNLFWDSRTKPILVGTIQPFESMMTVTFPGNSFHVAPTYDEEHALQRFTITSDESVVYYDPYTGDDISSSDREHELSKLSSLEYEKYNMHKLNLVYGREYLAVTQRAWLTTFPTPMHMHHMWEARYFGQKHVVTTKQTHFTSLPSSSTSSGNGSDTNDVWKKLDYEDYDMMLEEQHNGNANAFVQLPQYRDNGSLELTLKVVSVAPCVFEIDNFLSQIEIDHLIEMAKRYNVTTTEMKQQNQLQQLSTNQNTELTKAEKKKRKKVLKNAKSNAWIRREDSPIVNSIYHRAADMLQIDEALLRHRNEHEHTELNTHHSIAEAVHLTQYVSEQGYVPRLDGSQPSIVNRYQPNRFATIVFFLNDKEQMEGGDLIFPRAVSVENHDGIRIQPKAGKAVLFYNLLPDGNLDDLSQAYERVTGNW